MNLNCTYKIERGPSSESVEKYSATTEVEFRRLLDAEAPEPDVQRFLERNPALVPGARTPGLPSGHAPLHNVLVSQPRLPGLRSKVPDFMWIASHSGAWYPTLIEIECPSKKVFTSRSIPIPRAEFTAAYDQLVQWRTWFSESENVQTFIREYGVPEDIWRYRTMKLHMILIYGRRSEFERDSALSKHRSSISRDDEELMSFDRLGIDKDLRNVITVRATGSGSFRAVAVPPTFSLGPNLASRLSYINELENAIKISAVSHTRKSFLIRRLKYWRMWFQQSDRSLLTGADVE